MKNVKIFGINIKNTTLEEAKSLLRKRLDENSLYTIATPNTEIAMMAKDNTKYADLVNSFDLVLPDGIGLIYASKMKKKPLTERVTGFDISIELLKMGKEREIKLYILGGKPGISKKAKENVEKDYPGVTVVGERDGYFSIDDESQILNEINSKLPDVIFVGLGFPKQEEFINRNKDKINGKIIIGNGGVTDILAGVSNRAPEIFIKMNLEWFYRLVKQPSRIKRQLAIPRFMYNVAVNKNSVEEGDSINEWEFSNKQS